VGVNAGFEYREQVGAPAAGETVLAYLSRRYLHSSAALWRARIEGGEVELDGAPTAAAVRLRAGQSLVWRRPPWEEEPVPLAFAVLYRDAHLLAVAKPRGLPTIPNGGGFLTHTLLHLVRGLAPDASPLHRLGRGTSGLVLFGLTAEARAAVSAAWRTPAVRKVYRALVRGVPARDAFTVDVPIGPVPHPRLGRVHAACAGGRPSLSHVRVLAARGGDAVVDVAIDTGRPHQIRIHLAAAGHPLVGERLYVSGGRPAADPALPGEDGYWLHADRLELDHPATRERLVIACALPPDHPLAS
jgi:23S rRNA pseudouridine1911/1915/1917 synthase